MCYTRFVGERAVKYETFMRQGSIRQQTLIKDR